MITKFHVENFKNLADVTAEFGPVNVVIGPNGCGKSSLLQAIDFLRAFFYPSIEDYLNEKGFTYSDLPNLRQKGKAIRWHITAELGPDASGSCAGAYEYVVSAKKLRYLGVGEERLTFTARDAGPRVLVERSGRKVKTFASEAVFGGPAINMPRSLMAEMEPVHKKKCPEMFHFRDWITNFRSFLLWDPKVLRKPDRGEHLEVGPSGEHLAPVLANLRRESPEKFASVVRRIKRFFPTVTDITVKGGGGWGWQEVNLVEGKAKAVRFNSEQMSDGVLRVLAVSVLLHAKPVPGVIMFEEPENGIFPGELRRIFDLFEEWCPAAQFLFTSHSPYFIDMFDDKRDCVTILRKATDRSECITPPEPQIAEDEDRLTLSEEYASELFQ